MSSFRFKRLMNCCASCPTKHATLNIFSFRLENTSFFERKLCFRSNCDVPHFFLYISFFFVAKKKKRRREKIMKNIKNIHTQKKKFFAFFLNCLGWWPGEERKFAPASRTICISSKKKLENNFFYYILFEKIKLLITEKKREEAPPPPLKPNHNNNNKNKKIAATFFFFFSKFQVAPKDKDCFFFRTPP